ncbi:HTH domain-containing protein [Erysipelothrix rhusiopathiae]|nr:HTH domain-containing protein [Erysipelothrix rhusiopathiae]MDE8092137.1 HTH domain-containing protein [Erysipelothrix rhusiopathiae]MDE8098167.1 HTH domain-containing protein [Erysipelothrix rhusiopathiae]MDE8103384.1 HTH domain-containing protein [Erysipelothrix rhusiopathiae]MDE8106664.1 HTH domain-containing protein [Erysipelothrix rhusiopathiae]
MNSRQRRILEYLSDKKIWIKGKELSRIMGVTDRTIRSDIDLLNQELPGIVESSTREGYQLNYNKYQTYKDLNTDVIPQTPDERSIYIIKILLFSKKRQKIMDLQDEFFVSEHTIEGDIKRIRDLIKPYGGLKLVREKNTIFFQGNEHLKRKIYRDLLTNEIKDNFLNINRTALLYSRFDLVQVTKIFEETLNKYNYSVRETAIPMIVVHMGISIERMLSGHYLTDDSINKQVDQRIEFEISKYFYERIIQIVPIKYSITEVRGFANILMGYQNAYHLNDLLELSDIYGVSGMEYRVVKYLQEKINLPLEQDGIGSALFTQKGNGLRIMVATHMDEVGFYVKKIDEDGYLFLQPVGGIWPHVIMNQEVVVINDHDEEFYGIIGSKAMHGMTMEEKSKTIPIDRVYVDMGVSSKNEILDRGIKEGDMVAFVSKSRIMNDKNYICGKAFDDRASVAVGMWLMNSLINKPTDNEVTLAATVQEAVEKVTFDFDRELIERRGEAGDISIVAMNKNGEWGVASNIDNFSFSVATEKQANTVYITKRVGDHMIHEIAPQEWLDKYLSERMKPLEEK